MATAGRWVLRAAQRSEKRPWETLPTGSQGPTRDASGSSECRPKCVPVEKREQTYQGQGEWCRFTMLQFVCVFISLVFFSLRWLIQPSYEEREDYFALRGYPCMRPCIKSNELFYHQILQLTFVTNTVHTFVGSSRAPAVHSEFFPSC